MGSLGRLEELACQIGRIQGRVDPAIRAPHLVVFAGDHGAAAAGISAYPQEVTWQMVENFLAGGAAINVLARRQGLALTVVDVGVAHDFGGERPGLVAAKVAPGTASYLQGPAMTGETCRLAIARGAAIVRGIAAAGGDLVGLGEMGIGNTAAASLLIHGLTGAPLDTCVGRGTGLDDPGLARKRALLAEAWAGYRGAGDPLALLTHFGGLEIAALVGAIHAGAAAGMVVLIDGAIVTAAALVAERLAPGVAERCVFCHRSAEPGHTLALDALGAAPLLDLGLRLGEGTGAALAYPLVTAALDLLREMASFDEAHVATATREERQR